MEVAVLRWPSEASRRPALAGCPRLLVVDEGALPPRDLDCFEDWVRASTTREDLQARMTGLLARCRAHGPAPAAPPVLDGDGVMRNTHGWVALPALEARLAGVLVERAGTVVSRDTLMRAGWPHGASSRNSLDVHVLRLRRRLAPLHLAIRTVRSRGYLLESSPGRPPTVPQH